MSKTVPEIFTDALTCRLYANDASMYEEIPAGVCFPRDAEELAELVRYARGQKVSITARAAGTSLAGQTTGAGIIADTSRFMDRILEINAENKSAIVGPGVIRDALNREAGKHGLFFGPDTSTTNRCMIGGMIGNNSAGSYSIKYVSTREHVLAINAVLSDGSMALFEPLSEDGLAQKMRLPGLEGDIYRKLIPLLKKNKEAILEAYPHPDVKRRNTGYALDMLCGMVPIEPGGRPFNLAELLCGSEGTLALTASAEVRLVPVEPYKVLLIPHFHTLDDAMRATVEAVGHGPSAVELIDDNVLEATKRNIEQERNRFFLDGTPKCLLIIEFDGKDTGTLLEKAASLKASLEAKGLGYAMPIIEKPDDVKRVWELRKAGLGLLMGLSDDAKTPSFAEDTAVRVEDLPAYVADFGKLLDKYRTSCVFYAHASVGELHLRPVFDLHKKGDIERMKSMMEDVARLVKSYRGSLSGEHGDGRNRSPYIRMVIGDEMVELLRQVKEIFDPEYVLNPGKIVNPLPMDSNLRHNPNIIADDFDSVFSWRKENGFQSAIELCNGAGVCRKRAESGGTMCPSYMATLDEKDSTRGRANVFRQLFAEKGADVFESGEIHEALKLCLSCKACKSECPASVDMARMKSEFMQGWYDRNGIGFRERFWADPFPLLKIGATFPSLSNAIARSSIGRFIIAQLTGIHSDRKLPEFAKVSFSKWASGRETNPDNIGREVLLLIDPFTDLHLPAPAIAAWKLLDKLGFKLLKPVFMSSGRTLISGGQPKKAKKTVTNLIAKLRPFVERGAVIVGLEPSELLTLRDECPDLCGNHELGDAREIAANAFLLEEFVERYVDAIEIPINIKKEPVYVHGHCYSKALIGMKPLENALRKFGYEPHLMDTGCCGMAGSFGYRKETHAVSMKIGGQRLFPLIASLPGGTKTCTHGFSCHHQILDGTGVETHHPAELMAMALGVGVNQIVSNPHQ